MGDVFAQAPPQPVAKRGRGILTLAYGKRRFTRMASMLGECLKLHCDHIPRAVITDGHDPDLSRLYPIVIPYKPEFGSGLQQKLYLDQYSPFEETLFTDADCLVVHDLTSIWRVFSGVPFGVIGKPMYQGDWFGDVARLRAHFGVESIPRFNGGLLYFDTSERATAVFVTARDIMGKYSELGFTPLLRGGKNDEPVLAFALAVHGISAVDDGGSTMRTLIGLRGPLEIDVLQGYCRFNKEGILVEPAVAHFCGWNARGFYYQRECLKLHLAAHTALPKPLISRAVNAVCNPPHAAYTAVFDAPFSALARYYKRQKLRRQLLRRAV